MRAYGANETPSSINEDRASTASGPIDSQHGNGGAAHGGESDQTRAVPNKMILPNVPPWMEEPHDARGLWIHAGEIGAFVADAAEARQGQVGCLGLATVLLGNDVVELAP